MKNILTGLLSFGLATLVTGTSGASALQPECAQLVAQLGPSENSRLLLS